MPKTPPPAPTGSFTDLYEAMQQKRRPSTSNGHAAAHEAAPPSSLPDPEAAPPETTLASKPDSVLASVLAHTEDDVITTIRKTIRAAGKEVSFVRLTPGEKAELADIVYTYKRQGQKTSETEINRIAVNYMIQDYKANGERSILARVLASLLS